MVFEIDHPDCTLILGHIKVHIAVIGVTAIHCAPLGGADFLLVRLVRWLKIFIATDNLNRHNPFLSITEPFVEHLIRYALLDAALGLPLGSSKNCSIETPLGSPSSL